MHTYVPDTADCGLSDTHGTGAEQNQTLVAARLLKLRNLSGTAGVRDTPTNGQVTDTQCEATAVLRDCS
jgi:hypothetical protein